MPLLNDNMTKKSKGFSQVIYYLQNLILIEHKGNECNGGFKKQKFVLFFSS